MTSPQRRAAAEAELLAHNIRAVAQHGGGLTDELIGLWRDAQALHALLTAAPPAEVAEVAAEVLRLRAALDAVTTRSADQPYTAEDFMGEEEGRIEPAASFMAAAANAAPLLARAAAATPAREAERTALELLRSEPATAAALAGVCEKAEAYDRLEAMAEAAGHRDSYLIVTPWTGTDGVPHEWGFCTPVRDGERSEGERVYEGPTLAAALAAAAGGGA